MLALVVTLVILVMLALVVPLVVTPARAVTLVQPLAMAVVWV